MADVDLTSQRNIMQASSELIEVLHLNEELNLWAAYPQVGVSD